MSTAIVKLRTGAEVPEPLVHSVRLTLIRLRDRDAVALYEAVEVARDEGHEPWGNTGSRLEDAELLDRGVMPAATRDVILAATEGDEHFRLVSPYADDAAKEPTS